ncbi:hypothetical protein LBMAG18_00290 [Alphaproteobacteria bacterium]|nr:hypothetical protein LBMAG18_00290 [Alphaproteobacteria bacterium]
MIVNGFLKKNLHKKINEIINLLLEKKLKIAFAESCSGGLLGALITEFSGVSDIFDCSIVSYSNQSKIDFLGVKKRSLDLFGAVSEEVALEMANGLIKLANVDITVAVTGIAGPTGGNNNKPVGTVYIALVTLDKSKVKKFQFKGSRSQIRFETTYHVFEMILEELKNIRCYNKK